MTVTDVGYDDTSLGLSCDSYNEPEVSLFAIASIRLVATLKIIPTGIY